MLITFLICIIISLTIFNHMMKEIEKQWREYEKHMDEEDWPG